MQVVGFYYNEDLIKKISSAAVMYNKLINKSLLYLVISNNKQDIYMFEASYQPKHFQHLCGIKSMTKSSTEFFDSCLSKKIQLSDCTPAFGHSKTDICKKVSVLSDLLNIKNMKMFQTGEKEQLYGGVDFDFAVGDNCFIGYKYDSANKLCFPYSNMIAPIGAYCTDTHRISVILSKDITKEYYDKVEYEASKNLLTKVDEGIKDALSGYIMGNLLGREELQREQERFLLGEDELESVASEENPLVK